MQVRASGPSLLSRPGQPVGRRLASCLALFVVPVGGLAAPPPDAGQVQRQAERSLSHAPEPPPAVESAHEAEAASDGLEFVVRRFVLEGATLVPEATLQQALAPWRGQPLRFADLQAALRRIVAVYREHGWFARTQLPEQDITEGTVVVQVLEGRFGRLGVLDEGSRARGDFIAALAGRGLRAGEPYSLHRLERGLLLANDLPGVYVDGVLQPGQEPGTSDLLLDVRDQPLLEGSLAVGNDGSRYTGRGQPVGHVSLANPSGYGDQLSATGMRGRDLEYLGGSYALPLGAGGLRGNLGYSTLHYRLGKEFELLEASGASRTYRAGLTYPLHRSVDWNLETELAWSRRRQEDASFGEDLRRRHLRDLTLTLFGDAVHRGGNGAHTAWILDLVAGRARLALPDDLLADASGPGVHGPYSLARLELRHDRWLAPEWYLRARFSGQWAFDNLDSSQQFVLGGPSGVRGYPLNEAPGDSGAALQLELHRVLATRGGGELDGYGFVDGGTVRLRRHPWDGDPRNRYELTAAGLGLRWIQGGLTASLSVGVPVGSNPGTFDGNNQDGTGRAPQLWFNLRQRFPR
ncbi:ShlB/FhaC/HecB family hemolysin secretion/activation protein [Pseudoxanthomonas suwonensis]|uniref:ShlB/FhaC/HecB family hemolysin secretion/activation protein n=1 Tax=Pseudoxanthomonas suwonensis TaxID=314722 RepID=UPI00048BF195|nr:ShlB/FhaC/HecB family hemolysin secretion/activation protein [Pseudoxanthomonas suwonensis]